jgi:hypothetical protein
MAVTLSGAALGADDARTLASEAKALVEAKQAARAFALSAGYTRNGWAATSSSITGSALRRWNPTGWTAPVIAFERVLVRDPLFDSARLELARTYMRMGALDLAAQEFERLQARAPNPEGRKVLDEYLAEIARLRRASATASAATSRRAADATPTSRAARAISRTPSSAPSARWNRADRKLASPRGQLRRAQRRRRWLLPLAEDRTLYGAASIRWRGYQDFGDYDYLLYDFIGGYRQRAGSFDYNAGDPAAVVSPGWRARGYARRRAPHQRSRRGRRELEVRRDLDASTSIALGLQWMAYRYPSNRGQDTNQVIMSLAFDQRPAWLPTGTNVGLRSFYAHDEARRPLNPFTETPLRATATACASSRRPIPASGLSWQGALGWTQRIDDDAFARASLIATGRDNLYEALVRASWRIVPNLYLQPYAGYAYNKSNIELYSFRKADGGVMLRWEFR